MLETLHCNSCGATIELPHTASFVKCNQCGTNLTVNRAGAVTFTESLDQLSETSDDYKASIGALARHSKLAAHDEAWEKWLVSLGDPAESGQSGYSGVAGMLVFAIGWTMMTLLVARGASGLLVVVFIALSILFFGVAAFQLAQRRGQIKNFRDAREDYLQRRKTLEEE